MSPTRTTTLSFTRPMARKSSRQSMTGFDFGISLGTGKFAGPSSGKTSIVSPRSLLTAGSWPRRGPVDYSRADPSDPPVILYELASGQQAATLAVQEGENFLCNPFSPDGRFLASASDDRGPTHGSIVCIWDLATGREVRRFEGHLGRRQGHRLHSRRPLCCLRQ